LQEEQQQKDTQQDTVPSNIKYEEVKILTHIGLLQTASLCFFWGKISQNFRYHKIEKDFSFWKKRGTTDRIPLTTPAPAPDPARYPRGASPLLPPPPLLLRALREGGGGGGGGGARGQGQSGGLPSKQGGTGDRKGDANNKKEKKYEPAAPPIRVGKKQRKQKGPEAAARLPVVTPATKCKLRLLKLDRVKDYLLMEEEFVAGQERLKPQEDKNEEDRSKVDTWKLQDENTMELITHI
jgi:hypothetical protein